MKQGISEIELRQFAFDVYYKAISLLKKDGSTVIDIDNDIVDELIKKTLSDLEKQN